MQQKTSEDQKQSDKKFINVLVAALGFIVMAPLALGVIDLVTSAHFVERVTVWSHVYKASGERFTLEAGNGQQSGAFQVDKIFYNRVKNGDVLDVTGWRSRLNGSWRVTEVREVSQ